MEYWIWLTLLNGISSSISRKLINKFATPENIYNVVYEQLTKVFGVGNVTENIILNNKSLYEAKIILDNCYKNGINIVTCKEQYYSEYL